MHAGTQGELQVEDTHGGSKYIVPVKRALDTLVARMYDSTAVQEMGLFSTEQAVVELTSSVDTQPGATAHKTLLELNQAARNLQVYVKKEKLAGVDYLASGRVVTDPRLIAEAAALESEKEKFLNDPLIRALFPRPEAPLS